MSGPIASQSTTKAIAAIPIRSTEARFSVTAWLTVALLGAAAVADPAAVAVIGFLILLILIGMALGALRLLGLRGPLLTLAAAALMVGGAGYALQGRPDLRGSPARGGAETRHLPVAKARHEMLGRFTRSETWLTIADSFAARGKTADAVGLIQSGLRAHPEVHEPDDPRRRAGAVVEE